MNVLDWDRCEGSLTVRNWRPGDSYRTEFAADAKKIKTLFQENRVPLWERRSWPVIVSGVSIVWTRRFGVAREFAARPDSRRMLAVHERGESNLSLQTSIEVDGCLAESGGGVTSGAGSAAEERRPGEPAAEVL
jgi:tRNA(Ile)-lysidine synthetase-like protein